MVLQNHLLKAYREPSCLPPHHNLDTRRDQPHTLATVSRSEYATRVVHTLATIGRVIIDMGMKIARIARRLGTNYSLVYHMTVTIAGRVHAWLEFSWPLVVGSSSERGMVSESKMVEVVVVRGGWGKEGGEEVPLWGDSGSWVLSTVTV